MQQSMAARATIIRTCGSPPKCMYLSSASAMTANVQNAAAISAVWSGAVRRISEARCRDGIMLFSALAEVLRDDLSAGATKPPPAQRNELRHTLIKRHSNNMQVSEREPTG